MPICSTWAKKNSTVYKHAWLFNIQIVNAIIALEFKFDVWQPSINMGGESFRGMQHSLEKNSMSEPNKDNNSSF